MTYQNVPVADGYQVVEQISAFAASAGWVVHRDEESPFDTNFRLLTISNGEGAYITLAGSQDSIYLNGHRSNDNGKDWNDQPDQYVDLTSFSSQDDTYCRVRLKTNPILSAYLFGGSSPQTYLYVAIEVEPGYYRHITMGYFDKFGTALGGLFWDIAETSNNAQSVAYAAGNKYPFIYNSKNSGHNNTKGGFDAQDRDGNPAWVTFGTDYNTGYKVGGYWGLELNSQIDSSPIVFNSRIPFITPLVSISNLGLVPYGVPPAIRYVNMEYLLPGDEITMGDEVWKVFPLIRNVPSSNVADDQDEGEGSGDYGIAYLKD